MILTLKEGFSPLPCFIGSSEEKTLCFYDTTMENLSLPNTRVYYSGEPTYNPNKRIGGEKE